MLVQLWSYLSPQNLFIRTQLHRLQKVYTLEVRDLGRSFLYIQNSIVPRTKPCGTPDSRNSSLKDILLCTVFYPGLSTTSDSMVV